MFGLLLNTKEQDEVERFISQKQKKILQNEYHGWIRILLTLMSLAGLVCFIVLRCVNGAEVEEEYTLQLLMFNYFFVSLTFLGTIHFFPKTISIIITLIISFTLFTVTLMSNIKSEYRLTEYFLPALNIVFVLLTINPTQWKTNILAYGVGMFYLPYSVKSKYGSVPTD